MKSGRKIWSLPVVMAIVLVTGLVAVTGYVAAQSFTTTSPPIVENQIGDQEVEIDATAGASQTVVSFADVDGDDTTDDPAFLDYTAFTDDQTVNDSPDEIVHTAMTENPKVARVILTDDDTMVVQDWWNSLDGVPGDAPVEA